jgi:SAM-dependent methyltransferase
VDNIKTILKSNPPTSHWKKLVEEIEKLSNQPGVTWLGRIGQPEQYRQIMSCGMSVHCTIFQESGFISGLQEMAMGAIPIICPTWAAGDYCQHGTWIYGDPNDPLTQARFVGEIYRLMSNVALQEQIRKEMMPWARCCFNWERFVDLLENWMYGYNVQLGAQYLFAAKHSYGLGKILNVGCGDDGGQMKRFGAINTDKFAADPVTGMKHVPDVIADAREFPSPFEPHSFDVVVATEMLEHYADVPDEVPAQLLKFKELLAPGGRIVISVPDDRGQGFPVTEEPPKVEGLSAATTANPENYGWHKPVPRERVERWLEESGLKAIVWEETEYPWRDVTGHALVLVPEDSDAQRTEPVVYIPQKATRSVVYTDYDPENKLADMRAKSRESVQRWMRPGDEFIVSDQPGGWAKAVNDGVKQSHGDYIYVINNDLIVEDPAWMDKMAAPNTVTAGSGSPFTLTGDLDLELTLFCVPRNVWDAVGGMDEEFQTGICFDDNDLLARIRAAGFKTAIIPIAHRHLQSKTLMAYNDPTEYERRFLLNRALFKSKHPELEPKGGWLQ